jgi:hypothetical protein
LLALPIDLTKGRNNLNVSSEIDNQYTIFFNYQLCMERRMPTDNTSAAQRISNDILSSDYGILAISVMDTEGNIVAAKSKQSFKETFGVNIDGEKYGGILSNATLSLVNEVKNTVGEAQAIINIHNNWQINVTAYSITSDISWTCTSSFIQY